MSDTPHTQEAAPAAHETAPGSVPEIIDVWSRTAPKYRFRAIVMLLLLLLLFGGLCCFTFWLRTGVFWPFDNDQYASIMQRSFRPAGADQITLSDFLLAPISVKDVPVHGVIMGLLFASLCSIPILVAILYRFPFAVLFAAMVCFLAVMPWLGITIVCGCVLASLPRFRFRFRYASALLGLTPIALYFIMASWEPAGGRIRSVENVAMLYAPWVLALLSSCVIAAVVLALARIINYRPGGIAPVLALLFLTPVLIFHYKVGRDELNYRILEREIGPGSRSMFSTEDLGAVSDREATRRWSRQREASYDELFRGILEDEIERVQDQLENDRERAAFLCDEFMANFPRSPYIPNVLYLKGQALDQRLNRVKLLYQHRAEYRNDLPSPRSWGAWQSLAEQFPGHELAATAMLKLAVLRTRDGRMAEAAAWLEKLLTLYDTGGEVGRVQEFKDAEVAARLTRLAAERPGKSTASMFRRSSAAKSLGMEMEAVLRDAERLGERIAACVADAVSPASRVWHVRRDHLVHPLGILMSLDETDPFYATHLESLIGHFPGAVAAEYASLALIALEPAVSRRIARYREAVDRLSGGPARAEAMFHLAEVLQEDSLLDDARATLETLIRSHGDSCWARVGRQRLSSLAMTRG